jgi:hypothetical protein
LSSGSRGFDVEALDADERSMLDALLGSIL